MAENQKLAVFAHSCVLAVNRTIYRRMAADNWEIRIYLPTGGAIMPEPELCTAITLVQLPKKGTKSRFHYYEGLSKALDGFSPDRILLDLEPDSILACQIASWCSGREVEFYVQTCENQTIWNTTLASPWWLRPGLWSFRKLLLAHSRRKVSHLFPISSAGERLLVSMGFQGKTTRIPLGVSTELFQPDAEARKILRSGWNVSSETTVFAYFGRLIPAKGVHLLLEALGGMADLPWMLAIDDFEAMDSEYLGKISGMMNEPVFSGRLIRIHAKHEEVPAYMNAVDVVVVPSVRHGVFLEQYGRVVPEALACGTMVITSDSGALPEVGGTVTQKFPEGSVGELRKLLVKQVEASAEERSRGSEERRASVVQFQSTESQWSLMRNLLQESHLNSGAEDRDIPLPVDAP